LWALYSLGFDWEAGDFFHFIAEVAGRHGAELQIMYGLDGRPQLEESALEHLSGYEGARPVRIGNAAYLQSQNDVWGSLVGAAWLHWLHAAAGGHMRPRSWPVTVSIVERALAHWREPDCGLWEVRGEPQHFTYSKVACWIAADRGARLARLQGDSANARRWSEAAAEIQADVCANALDERGVFTQHYGTSALDASVLLLVLVGFLPPEDYRFWLVSALVAIGELQRGRALCERLLSYSSELGLYAEEIDPRGGRHLGNFPQALTHLALIHAVMSVIRAEKGQRTSVLSMAPEPQPS